jgi:hypothetical protein
MVFNTKALEIRLIISTTFEQRHDMIDFLGLCDPPKGFALHA